MKVKLAAGALALALAASPALAQHEGHGPADAPPPPPPAADPHDGHDMPPAAGAVPEHSSHAMTGALGPHPLSRGASGTAWQPDSSPHRGLHLKSGPWTLMGHTVLHGVYDRQLGLGGLFSFSFVPGPLEPSYSDDPKGGMLFLRLRID